MNKRARGIGMGPEAVARDIRLLRGHQGMTVTERYSASFGQLSKAEAKSLEKMCKKLLKYVT